MTTRRDLLGTLGAVMLAPELVLAQAAKQAKVVVLFAGDSDDDEPSLRPFFDEMRRRGWVEGQNITYERLSGRGVREYLEGLAQIAIGLEPQLIYATNGSLSIAVSKANQEIPLVFTTAADPVAIGLVDSLARPGRNATGAYQFRSDVIAKRMVLVREALPGTKRIGALFERRTPEYERLRKRYADAARAAGVELAPAEFTNFEAVAKLLANYRRQGTRAVLTTPSFVQIARRHDLAKLALVNNLALIGHRSDWADAGALLAYGADVAESYTLTAGIADRVLKGARASETPVAQATRLELVVNLRTAKTLGIDLPKQVLASAGRVVE